jgi:hypothetical protein
MRADGHSDGWRDRELATGQRPLVQTSSQKGTGMMAIDLRDHRPEIAAFYEEVVRDLDRRLARIEHARRDTYRSVPAWQHLAQRRTHFLRLRAEAEEQVH